ncbi:MAG: methyl-accepting chemotaxis protein, partial [Lachnospiraceae bacterium]|nr:methyl-accepting chemotaxis protein [Lachnospiraceae bacterium]
MRTAIIALVAVITAIGVTVLCILASVNSNKILKEMINEDMTTYLNGQVNAVQEFVSNSEQKLKLFAQSPLIKGLIKDDMANAAANPGRELPDFADPTYNTTAYYTDNYPNFTKAQDYTMQYASTLGNWEGLYVGNLETRILSYSVPPVIGKVLRTDPAKVEALIGGMKADLGSVLNAGIIVSPGTGQLCLSMYCPVLDNGEMIGYVGAGVFHTDLEELLTSYKLNSVSTSHFYMVNTQTSVTFTDTQAPKEEQESVIAKETTRPVLLEVISKAGISANGQFEFDDPASGKTLIVSYETVPGHEWAVVITAEKDELYAASSSNMTTMIILGIVTFLLILALVALMVTMISNSLKKAVNEIDKTATGDITSSVEIKSPIYEVGQISESLGKLKSRLNEVIIKTRDMSRGLSVAGSDLTASADLATSTTSIVTGAVDDISKGAVSQAQSVQTAASKTDSMGDDIDRISKNILAMDEASVNMKKSGDKAAKALENIVVQNKKVADAVSEIGATIHETNNSANEISKFSDAINSIASQTNLLSLNASIEAARAGEAGRGFAVVADEIRDLADQSNASANEIKTIVDKLLADAESSVKTLDTLNECTRIQGEQIAATQNDMRAMVDDVEVVSTSSRSISEMIKNLEVAKESLVDIIKELSGISEENASATEETGRSVYELSSTFNVISESVQQLQTLSNELTNTISYFK